MILLLLKGELIMNIHDEVRNYFLKNKGKLTIKTLRGKVHNVYLSDDEKYIYSHTALRNQKIYLNCFDIVVNYLRDNGGRAKKGCGHNKADKVVYGKCTPDTICWCIATKYHNHRSGESTFDPVFIICAILESTGICKNGYGVLELNSKYY